MKISIAIPCYEMFGKGVEMLQHSFSIMKGQTEKDFEVVVSDHSVDNKIQILCEQENKDLNIKYIRNENKRGSSSANTNNAIRNCSGEIIKILCQDDFLFANNSLEKTILPFNYNQKWVVTDYLYIDIENADEAKLYSPKWNDKIYLFNTVGTHSCLAILNENPIFFDENLIWYMDCEYYYRLYLRYGEPAHIPFPTVMQAIWSGQVSKTIINSDIVEREKAYILERHEEK